MEPAMLRVLRSFKWPWMVLLCLAGAAVLVMQERICRFDHQAVVEARSPMQPASESILTGGLSAPRCAYGIVNTYPHDPGAFTQGLVYLDGALYESTGLHGKSTVRKVKLETGETLKSISLLDQYFGEGLTEWRGTLIQLTWRSKVGFVYDRESFAKLREFTYESEGWGITHDGVRLIMSDGTAILRFLDPDSYREVRRVRAHDSGIPIRNLNELEYIKGEIYANVWRTDYVARISPETGEVLGWIDFSPLREALSPVQFVDALNGIAYDPALDRIFITGKLWPRLFEIELY